MRARLVVFPLKGRNWCFSRSKDPCIEEAASALTPSTLKHLWKNITSSSNSSTQNVELVIDYVSNKMNKAWMRVEKAPEGSFKNKLHGVGLKLLSRVRPSEIFLKSISKEVTNVEITYPSSLNARLVRRRLRHIAMRGAAIHRKHFYGSVSLLPLTTVFSVLPLPNIPFFWLLFRSYSNWRALQGSEKLLLLVSDSSIAETSAVLDAKRRKLESEDSKHKFRSSQDSPWVLQPSKELGELLKHADENGLDDDAISDICKTFSLNLNDVIKFRHSMY